jgi:hypothetical protein
VTRALHTRGLAEARLLLQDWLSSFVTRCVRSRTRADGLVRNAATLEMILEQQHPHLTVRKVSTCPQRSVCSPTPPPARCQFLLRYVYGLLLHPLLAFDTDADQRVADELLLSYAPPSIGLDAWRQTCTASDKRRGGGADGH